MAQDDNATTTKCNPAFAGDTVIWNGSQFCAVEQGSGGGGGTGGAGSTPGARQGSEIIWASSDAPRDAVVECFRNPARCLSHQFGGRGGRQGIDGDGPGSGGSRGGGKGSAGPGKKSETKPKLTPKQECQDLAVDGMIWSPESVVIARRTALRDKRSALRLKIGELRWDLADAQGPIAVATIESKIGALDREAVAVEREIGAISDAQQQWEKKKCAHLLYDV